ncbi:MAG: VOC family protein [Kangiellaceae bacterium]
MSEQSKVGKIEWCDLTVNNASELRDFYSKVVGWESAPVSMGDYDDYGMNLPGSDQCVSGICHAKGPNANMPAQWLMYVRVQDIEQSAKQCIDAGGEVIEGLRSLGSSNFCVIKDPAGAVLALISD